MRHHAPVASVLPLPSFTALRQVLDQTALRRIEMNIVEASCEVPVVAEVCSPIVAAKRSAFELFPLGAEAIP